MKLTICQSDLDYALRTIAPAVGVRSSHPILDYCLITAAGGTMSITGFNLDLGITVAGLPAAVETDGAVALPYRLLAGIIARMEPDSAITIDGGSVSTGGAAYELSTQPSEDYPALPVVSGSEATLALSGAVRACMVAVSTDASKQMLTGIHLGAKHMSATDGHRLMRYAVELPDELDLTLPASTMRLLVDQTCNVQFAAGQAVITTGNGTTIYSRVLDGAYPNVAQLIPESFQHTMTLNRHRLTRALERAAIIAETHNSVVKLTAASGGLSLTAECDANNAKELLPYTGTSTGVWAVNVTYLLDGLKALKSAESIDICCNAATAPIVLKPSNVDGQTYLVMPVQVRSYY
jgi:DNA polymerase III subunit beta